MAHNEVMLQEAKQQLANIKISADERIQETQEACQAAIARASEAEERARELEKTVSSLQDQLHVDQVHRQLWPPHQSEGTVAQVVENSSGDALMEEPAVQGVETSHDTSMASHERNSNRHSNDDDTDMSEVNRII
jgi:hypothetical protein